MKKLIIILFIFAGVNSFGQENEYNKKHNLLWDFGVNHSSNFRPVYYPAYEIQNKYFTPETLYPGYFLLPVFNFQTDITYRYYLYKRFNINAVFKGFYNNSILLRNIDSVSKYYVYPDSIIKTNYSPIPLYNNIKTVRLGLTIMLGYKYKRMLISCGLFFPFYERINDYREYEKNNKSNLIYNEHFNFIDFTNFDIKTEFLVNKKKIPLSVFLEYNKILFGGIQMNIIN